jgi:NADPH:quinone reductase-like Zn-dependent oxidoreductase
LNLLGKGLFTNPSQFVKSLGADLAFDYNDAECSKKINEATEDKLRLAFDCISEGSSPEISSSAISSQGGKVVYLLQTKHSREDVENIVCFPAPHPRKSFY